MSASSLPVLTTRRLRLRPFTQADAAQVRSLAGDREIAEKTLNVPHPYEPGMAEDWIATHPPGFECREFLVKLGMTHGGYKRQHYFKLDQFEDVEEYELLRADHA